MTRDSATFVGYQTWSAWVAAALMLASALLGPVFVYGLDWTITLGRGFAGFVWPLILAVGLVEWWYQRRLARDAIERRRIDYVFMAMAIIPIFAASDWAL